MILVFFVITIVWAASYVLITRLFGNPQSPSDVGNLFAAIGALFSGWAFCGILWAILLQRKALKLQHEDLKATLEEIKQSREAHQESAEAQHTQLEMTRLQIRTSILKTLIETPLQVDSNTFLSKFSQAVIRQRDEFEQNIEELRKIEGILREEKE